MLTKVADSVVSWSSADEAVGDISGISVLGDQQGHEVLIHRDGILICGPARVAPRIATDPPPNPPDPT